MNIGFYYHIPAVDQGGLVTRGDQGCFIDSLASQCSKVICFLHSPNPQEQIMMDYKVKATNVELVDLGLRGSAMNRTLQSRKFIHKFKRYFGGLDLLLLRGPSPLLPALAWAASVPIALLLVGDYTSGVNDLPQPRWRKELIRIWSHWNKAVQTKIARKSLTFVNSHLLFQELERKVTDLVEIRTTTLNDQAFFERTDTCQQAPVKLLYVGRMDRGKGLLEITRALSLLVQSGENVTLDFVGWAEKSDPALEDITSLAAALGISDRVNFLGPRSMGPELFACYRDADIFVIASMAAEGFPRSIWEAMANSTPVVATRVGSIPAFIEGAAELIKPDRDKRIAQAVRKLIHTPELRQENIRRGMALARQNTLDTQTTTMVNAIHKWLLRRS